MSIKLWSPCDHWGASKHAECISLPIQLSFGEIGCNYSWTIPAKGVVSLLVTRLVLSTWIWASLCGSAHFCTDIFLVSRDSFLGCRETLELSGAKPVQHETPLPPTPSKGVCGKFPSSNAPGWTHWIFSGFGCTSKENRCWIVVQGFWWLKGEVILCETSLIAKYVWRYHSMKLHQSGF